jgi:hypothetical protein
MALFTVTLMIFQKSFIFLKMAIIWLQLTEISLKFESSSQNIFDFNRLKIVNSKAVSLILNGILRQKLVNSMQNLLNVNQIISIN